MKAFMIFLISVSAFIINGCSDDSTPPTTGGTTETIVGNWEVEQAQMVEAPSGNSIADVMKQALVPFGLVNVSNVGYCFVTFNNDSTWNMIGNISNLVFRAICNVHDTLYTASGVYYTTSNGNISFVVTQFSGYFGNQRAGGGTYSIANSKLTINLSLADNEKWKIIFKKP